MALIVEIWPIARLLAHPENYKKHPPAQVKRLMASLDRWGWRKPIVARPSDGLLIAGHGLLEAAIEKGLTDAHVAPWECTDDEALGYLVADNETARGAETDEKALAALLEHLTACQITPEQVGLSAQNLKDLLKMLHPPGPEPAGGPPADGNGPAISVLGEIYELGPHRLICGDATNAETVARLLGKHRPNVMVTDPPYGVNLDQSWRDKALAKNKGAGNKNLVTADDRADWREAWANFPGNVAYIWHASRFSDVVMASLRASNFEICQQLIWNKSVMTLGRNDYHFKHEPCWYAVRKGKTHAWTGDRKQTTVIDAKSPNQIFGGSTEEQTAHPTQKPLECMSLFKNHAGDVYDPFGGSGTTLIAAAQEDRTAYLVELDPRYCDIIRRRWTRWADANGLEPGAGALAEPSNAGAA